MTDTIFVSVVWDIELSAVSCYPHTLHSKQELFLFG